MAKSKAKTEISPKGIFVYPRLNAPDTKFDEAGVYTVKLQLTSDAAQPLMSLIDEAITAQVAQVKTENKGKTPKRAAPPYTVDEDTGDVSFNFKMKATITSKDGTTFTQKPALKTASLKDLPESKLIGGGSEGKVAFTIAPYYTAMVGAGVSLRLRAVQVFKLVEPSFSYGFEAEDGEEFDDDSSDIDEAQDFAKADDSDSTEEVAGDDGDF